MSKSLREILTARKYITRTDGSLVQTGLQLERDILAWHRAALEQERKELRETLWGMRLITCHLGPLYGVGWNECLTAVAEKLPPIEEGEVMT